MNRPQKRKQEEAEALHDALRTFEDEFGGVIPPSNSKKFIRGDVVENNKTISAASGKIYMPESKVTLKLGGLPASAASFEEAKRLAAEKARRMLAEAHRGTGPAPAVVAPSTAKPLRKPAKPGTNKNQKSRTTNLDAFKEELKRVQEERDKRKGLRDHLRNELGVDQTAVDRIAPVLDKPYAGNGEFDDDPYTTNLYICNLPQDVVMEDILDTFGSFGPLASAKVLYPRTEEEKRREHLCGFVAYMCRVDADRAIAALQHGLEINGDPVKISFARPVSIPPQPFYVPPGLQELAVPDPPTGLPFNAKPLEKDITEWKEKYEELPPLGPPLPNDWSDARVNAYNEMIKNATIRVVIPTDSALLHVIHRTVEFVIREGPIFEAMLMGRESHNSLYRFLFDTHHPAHVYYRWKLFSVLQGDRLDTWRMMKFRMFLDGSWWEPPLLSGELLKAMPSSLYHLACNVMNPERWFPTIIQKKSVRANRFIREKKEMLMRAEQERKRKTALSKSDFKELDTLLRQLTPEKEKIGDAMLWCAEHASCAQEVVETLYESLTIDETPLHKKIARLYLISDILANCAQRGVKDIFFYRQYFEEFLNKIFDALGDTLKNIEGRLKAEQFKTRVMECFRVWEETALYPREILIHNQNIFLGLVEREKGTPSSSEDEDIDGAPIDEDDIDGVPLGGNIYDDLKDDDLTSEPPKKKAAFKPTSWDEVAVPKELSKWERSEETSTANKWEQTEKTENQSARNLQNETAYKGSGSDGEINDKDSPKTVHDNAAYQEERRKLLRDVEVKVLTCQEDLQSEKEPDIKRKVEEYRKKLMSELDAKLEENMKRKSRKRDKKSKSKDSYKRDERRDHEREKDRRRDREDDRNREHDKDSGKRERDRSRNRRGRSRNKDGHRRRSNSREHRRDHRSPERDLERRRR